jgi:excisionase family DNA binding protein
MRQVLDIVLRELAHTITRALPVYPTESLSTSQAGIDSGKSLSNGQSLVRISDAAAMLSISRTAFYRLLSEGKIRTIQIGKSRRVPVSALQDFIARELRVCI